MLECVGRKDIAFPPRAKEVKVCLIAVTTFIMSHSHKSSSFSLPAVYLEVL